MKRRRRGRLFLLLAIILVCVSFWLAAASVNNDHYKTAQAEVVNKDQNGSNHSITYRITLGPNILTDVYFVEETIPVERWELLEEGSTIKASYYLENGNIYATVDENPNGVLPDVPIAVICILCIGVLVMGYLGLRDLKAPLPSAPSLPVQPEQNLGKYFD